MSSRGGSIGRSAGIALGVLISAGVAAVVLLLVLGGGSKSPLNPIARAAERTANSPGWRVEFTGSYVGGDFPAGFRMEGTGSFNGRTKRSQSVAHTVNAPDPPGDFDLNSITDGSTIFMSGPLVTAELPEGKTWLKIELGSLDSNSDPRGLLDQLRSVSGDVENRGRETVRGVTTTHYSARVDLHKRVDLLRDQGDDEAADQLEKVIDAIHSSSVPTDVWIDQRDLVRRQRIDMPFGILNSDARIEMTMEFFDFGIKPNIGLPSSDAVYDATDLAKRGLDLLAQ